MRRKIFAFLLVFIIATQVFSVPSWVSIAMNYANGNTADIAMLIIDEEIEEEGAKMAHYQEISNNTLHPVLPLPDINKEVQYLHHSDLLKEGFVTILYTPPNLA